MKKLLAQITDDPEYKFVMDVRKDSDFYNNSYQKCVKDEDGIKYFINFHVYSDRSLGRTLPQLEADTQFIKGKSYWNFAILDVEMTLEKAETVFEDLWTKMECDYYEYWGR